MLNQDIRSQDDNLVVLKWWWIAWKNNEGDMNKIDGMHSHDNDSQVAN